jgi:hypothetical protein
MTTRSLMQVHLCFNLSENGQCNMDKKVTRVTISCREKLNLLVLYLMNFYHNALRHLIPEPAHHRLRLPAFQESQEHLRRSLIFCTRQQHRALADGVVHFGPYDP